MISAGGVYLKRPENMKKILLGCFENDRINKNGECLLDVCVERLLLESNTLLKHKKIERRKNDETSMIDYILIDNRLKKKPMNRGFPGYL